jgi:spore coat polysaccharide biosynthesis protein SpsF
MTKTVCIIQARMASTRLPGKVLLDLNGRSVLSYSVERCLAIPSVDEVCCAIPETADCDPIAEEAKRCGATITRGSESDVLERYYQAAKHLNADVILRVTSDCPLIDPNICNQVLQRMAEEKADYACNSIPPSWPHGLDCQAFTFSWLERAHREATDPFDREHVAPFIRKHPDARKVNFMSNDPSMVHHRWTLDTPADLEFFRSLMPHLPEGPAGWNYQTPLKFLQGAPEISAINADHVELSRAKTR